VILDLEEFVRVAAGVDQRGETVHELARSSRSSSSIAMWTVFAAVDLHGELGQRRVCAEVDPL
jgi:hypothetical protein